MFDSKTKPIMSLTPKPIKARPFLVALIEIYLNAPDGTDQHTTAAETIKHRLCCKMINNNDLVDAGKASESAKILPIKTLAEILSALTKKPITEDDFKTR